MAGTTYGGEAFEDVRRRRFRLLVSYLLVLALISVPTPFLTRIDGPNVPFESYAISGMLMVFTIVYSSALLAVRAADEAPPTVEHAQADCTRVRIGRPLLR
ncbi:MAG: hypothetical protein AAGA48_27785 [Myxococcota bacterium]